MARECTALLTLAYSGGAVPDSHRSSLFCRRLRRTPTTNARYASHSNSRPVGCQTLSEGDSAAIFTPSFTSFLATRTPLLNNGRVQTMRSARGARAVSSSNSNRRWPMPIQFPCSQCGRLIEVPDSAAGAKARCPLCSSIGRHCPAGSQPCRLQPTLLFATSFSWWSRGPKRLPRSRLQPAFPLSLATNQE